MDTIENRPEGMVDAAAIMAGKTGLALLELIMREAGAGDTRALGAVARITNASDMPVWMAIMPNLRNFAPVLLRWAARTKPDFTIGTHRPYLHRWFIVREHGEAQVFLHQTVADDDDRALHDHPWDNVSVPLAGGYIEHTPEHPDGIERKPFVPILRSADMPHRLSLLRQGKGRMVSPIPAWSLFLTGPKVREWGFLCPQGWRHWKDFTSGADGAGIGKGCA